MTKRFRLDTGCIIDQENNEVLSDKKIRNLLNKQDNEIKELKEAMKRMAIEMMTPQQKPFLKIYNDYFIKYGDEGDLFSMHKPSDIRSLCYLINRDHGYSELQSEYNDINKE